MGLNSKAGTGKLFFLFRSEQSCLANTIWASAHITASDSHIITCCKSLVVQIFSYIHDCVLGKLLFFSTDMSGGFQLNLSQIHYIWNNSPTTYFYERHNKIHCMYCHGVEPAWGRYTMRKTWLKKIHLLMTAFVSRDLLLAYITIIQNIETNKTKMHPCFRICLF